MVRWLRGVGIALLFPVAFFALYLSAAFVCSRITLRGTDEGVRDVTIYIKTNGVHTDIVVPVHNEQMDWSRVVPFADTKGRDTGFAWLALGWGDKGFYLYTPEWKDLKASTAFNAAFGLSTAAMHTTYYRDMAEGKQCRKIVVSRAQYARLVQYICGSFQKAAGGRFIHIVTNANYGSSDAFYEANGRYNLFRTCNTWANSSLKASGQKCCLWTIFDTGIFLKYE